MTLVLGSCLGFIFGVIACWLFWKYLLVLKPNVAIAPVIAMTRNEQTGRRIFRFKIYNKGARQVIGITLNGWVVELLDVPGGQITKALYKFPIRNSETMALNPENTFERPWDLNAETYFRTEPEFDTLELLSHPGRRVMITLRVSDALSGTTVVQQKTYEHSDFKEGMFRIGESMEIEPI